MGLLRGLLRDRQIREDLGTLFLINTLWGRDDLGLSAAEIARQVGVNTSVVRKVSIERAEQP